MRCSEELVSSSPTWPWSSRQPAVGSHLSARTAPYGLVSHRPMDAPWRHGRLAARHLRLRRCPNRAGRAGPRRVGQPRVEHARRRGGASPPCRPNSGAGARPRPGLAACRALLGDPQPGTQLGPSQAAAPDAPRPRSFCWPTLGRSWTRHSARQAGGWPGQPQLGSVAPGLEAQGRPAEGSR